MQLAYAPYVQIRSNCLVVYYLNYSGYKAGKASNFRNPYSGNVTKHAAKRLKTAIDLLVQKCPTKIIYNPVSATYHPFRLSFATLTVSDDSAINTDTAHQLLLKPLLRKIRKNSNLLYVWKAEFQERGNLHYHLTTNQFLHHSTLRNDWNNLQRKAGLLNKYALKHKTFNANSTDIHSVKHVKDLSSYLAKYVSKTNSRETTGKTWDCSKELKMKHWSTFLQDETSENLYKYADKNSSKVIHLERCTILKHKNPELLLSAKDLRDYKNYIT